MKNKTITQDIIYSALIVCLYFVLSLPFNQICYGIINIRISEIFLILVIYNKKYSIGLILGCFVVNLFSSLPFDIIVGTLQTVVACAIVIFVKNKPLSVLLAAISCGVMIGSELYFAYEYPLIVTMLSVFISELLILEFGYYFWKFLFKNARLKKLIVRDS